MSPFKIIIYFSQHSEIYSPCCSICNITRNVSTVKRRVLIFFQNNKYTGMIKDFYGIIIARLNCTVKGINMKLHIFAICAYKDSPYLEACIRSLQGQSVKSDIILCTSTPSPYIETLAGRYGIPVYVRHGKSNIQDDWNYAYHMADAQLVTIAHQDDLYQRDYVKKLLESYEKYPDMSLFTGGYVVIKENKLSGFEKVEFIKRFLRLPLRLRPIAHVSWVKKSVLMFGNSICCPACTYNKELLGEKLFTSPYHFALDWDTFFKLAGRPGRFICVEKPLLYYRVHEEAATKACMMDNSRSREEAHMFAKMWPGPVTKLLMHFYRKAYKEYE